MPTITKGRRGASPIPNGEIPTRPFGRHDELVSALALGGYHLGLVGNQREAIRIVHAAIDAGITFMDNAWEYNEGTSEEILGKALVGRRDHVFLMTKVCTHGRDRAVARRQLKQSLRRLKTDHLDLWQVHECVYPNDPEHHFASGGVIEALVELHGPHKAKIRLDAIGALGAPRAKIVVVTAMTPTPLGEGKTVNTIGLSLGLNRIGKRTVCALRLIRCISIR